MEQKASGVEQAVRDFIQNELLFGQDVAFSDDDSFLEAGIIDSTGILELVTFLEERYGFQVEDNELIPENLDSVSRLGQYVRAKCGGLIQVNGAFRKTQVRGNEGSAS
jgi:acyl carrier protein